MTCCEYKCEQGRNCPVRKQRIEATNQAYIERGRLVETDPYVETVGSVKSLIAWLGLALGVWIVCLVIWGTT
jgi:hypothetical protein